MRNITKKSEKIGKKIIIFSLISVFIFSPLTAIEAEAQWVVWDPGNFVPNTVTAVSTTIGASAGVVTAINTTVAGPVKEFGFDTIAWMIVNLVIERMAASTVNWINRGFRGSPAFITDPEGYFTDLGDKIAGEFILRDPALGQLCGPIGVQVRLTLAGNYRGNERRWQCTLTDVTGNFDDFMDDFDRGGWDNFFKISQQQQNNPIGAYLMAESELFGRIAAKTDEKNKELDRGNGFLSWKECAQYDSGAAGQTNNATETTFDPETGEEISREVTQKLPDVPKKCIKDRINTPGSVISEQLNQTLGIGGQKLAVADEINEMVSALLNQLVGQIVGGIGKGLRGLSRPPSTGGSSSFVDQLTQRKPGDKIYDYFGDTPEGMEIIDAPLPQFEGAPNYNLNQGRIDNPTGTPTSGSNNVIDVCPNIPGNQETVPEGQSLVNGECVDTPL